MHGPKVDIPIDFWKFCLNQKYTRDECFVYIWILTDLISHSNDSYSLVFSAMITYLTIFFVLFFILSRFWCNDRQLQSYRMHRLILLLTSLHHIITHSDDHTVNVCTCVAMWTWFDGILFALLSLSLARSVALSLSVECTSRIPLATKIVKIVADMLFNCMNDNCILMIFFPWQFVGNETWPLFYNPPQHISP